MFKGSVHPLQRLHGVLIATQLLRQLLVFVQNAVEDLLGIVVEFMELIGGSEDLRPCVDELQQVCPGLVQAVLPLSNGGGVAVACVDQLISLAVDSIHTFLTNAASVTGKFSETLLQHLKVLKRLYFIFTVKAFEVIYLF